MPRPGLSEQPSSSSANPARAALVLLTYRNIAIDKRVPAALLHLSPNGSSALGRDPAGHGSIGAIAPTKPPCRRLGPEG